MKKENLSTYVWVLNKYCFILVAFLILSYPKSWSQGSQGDLPPGMSVETNRNTNAVFKYNGGEIKKGEVVEINSKKYMPDSTGGKSGVLIVLEESTSGNHTKVVVDRWAVDSQSGKTQEVLKCTSKTYEKNTEFGCIALKAEICNKVNSILTEFGTKESIDKCKNLLNDVESKIKDITSLNSYQNVMGSELRAINNAIDRENGSLGNFQTKIETRAYFSFSRDKNFKPKNFQRAEDILKNQKESKSSKTLDNLELLIDFRNQCEAYFPDFSSTTSSQNQSRPKATTQ